MLNIMLKKAYDDLNNRVIDFNRYININNLGIEYKDFGTQFDDDVATFGQIDLSKNHIYINEYIYDKKFKLANKCKLKFFRKDAHELYNKCVSTIKHELIHLYLYKKYEYLNGAEPYGSFIYSDLSPLFIVYCELCEAGVSIESKQIDLYESTMLFTTFYKENYDYKNDLYELHSFINKEFRKEGILEYFNAYSVFEKLNFRYKKHNKDAFESNKEVELFEGIKKVVRDRLSSWNIDINEQFNICS